MSKINVTHIDSLDISQMTNTQVTVSGSSMTLTPLPSDESDYERGMRRAMQKIAVSCGRVFGADVGHEDLPDLVESIVRSKKESAKLKSTKFAKVEESIFDLKGEFERGELFTKLGDKYMPLSGCEKAFASSLLASSIYRQVEIDWRDEVEKHRYVLNAPYYSMRNDPDKFIAMCHAIAELTDKPE